MTQQLTFDLPVRQATGRAEFFVSPASAEAIAYLDRPDAWPGGRLALVGPEAAGKSHLAAIWAADQGAAVAAGAELARGGVPAEAARPLVIEDADRAVPGQPEAERALLHTLNRLAEAGCPVLLTARTPPARWGVRLPDLASRLGAVPVASLSAPDDALLRALLVKNFADRQLAVDPRLIAFLLPRMERSAAAAAALVERLDRAALRERRGLTLPFARDVLGS